MSSWPLTRTRERFAADQADARERSASVAAAIEARLKAREEPNFRLIVKANGEGEVDAYVRAHGLTPGEIARLGDLKQFRCDVWADWGILHAWFVEANLHAETAALTTYADGTLLLYSAIHRDSDGQEAS